MPSNGRNSAFDFRMFYALKFIAVMCVCKRL
nr:MAG TPA: hypothetical protein [Caudoviricetes sp.]